MLGKCDRPHGFSRAFHPALPCYASRMRLTSVALAALLAVAALPVAAQSSGPPASPAWGGSGAAQWGTPAPLPEDEAFRAEAIADGTSVLVRLTPAPGYYLYRHTFEATPLTPDVRLGAWTTNQGEMHDDPHFGRVEVFFSPAEISVPVAAAPTRDLTVRLAFQGCQADGICYPPMVRTLPVTLETLPVGEAVVSEAPTTPVATAPPESPEPSATAVPTVQAEDERLAAVLRDRPLWQAWLVFFGLGVVLGLTPCVLPMVPVLLGLIAGARPAGPRQALALAGTYVGAHAAVFAALGAAAALAGAGLQAVFQQAWVLVPMALGLAALGAWLVAGRSLQMPSAVQRWAGGQGRGGTWAGAATMGALSSLIIGPCVAPPLAGAVLYLAQAGDPVLGAGALFALGLGMGGPLLLAAAGLGTWLPRRGAWADPLSRAFGLGFLALAAWLATRAWPAPSVAVAGALILLAVAAWVWAGKAPHGTPGQRQGWATGMALGAVLALGWGWGTHQARMPASAPTVAAAPLFAPVRTEAELDARLRAAAAEGKTVVLDFYADWCTACLDMEKGTFADPAVRARLASPDLVALKVDVTDNGPDARALMNRYGIIGPPATLFLQRTQETRAARLVGAEASAPFLARVNALPTPLPVQCKAPDAVLAATPQAADGQPC